MVSTFTWVLAGIVAYTILGMILRARGVLPESVRLSGPITTIHTKHGRVLLDRLSRPKRFWRAWGNLGVGIALVIMVGAFAVVILAAVAITQQPEAQAIQNPQNVLVIPGVNDFLPPSAAPEIIAGLAIALVVHEGGHGLLCRVEDIDIDSMGLAFFTLVPIGAFVEPDEEDRAKADRGGQTRMFAAGVTNNFAITVVAFLLLFGPVAGSIAVVDGVHVGSTAAGSSAAAADIQHGDVITSVAGTNVSNVTEADSVMDRVEERTVTVTLRSGERVQVERRLIVRQAVGQVVSGINLSTNPPPRIVAINGSEVYTERGFERALSNRSVAAVQTTNGNATMPVGAFAARVQPGGALEEAGAPANASLVITSIGGERVQNASVLTDVLSGYEPGDSATVTAVVDGERRSFDVTFGGSDDRAVLGVNVVPGTTGLVVDEVGIDEYPASLFLRMIGGTGDGLLGGLTSGTIFAQIYTILLLPFLSLFDPAANFDFAGFTGGVQNFYTATGPLSVLGSGVVLMLANVLFWTGWINIQVGLFNCIPTFPLDGGHILRSCTESVVARLPVDDKQTLTTALTGMVTVSMIVSLFLMILGPQLLS